MEEGVSKKKRKILFHITVGSKRPERDPDLPLCRQNYLFPVGGDTKFVDIEFCTEGGLNTRGTSQAFDDACEALAKHMKDIVGRDDYHIWYWDWLN
jgi:hypothetical protein